MQLTIISPNKTLFKGECKLVQIPGTDGLFEVLDNHAPIIALLGKGKIKVQKLDGEEFFFNIEDGMLKIQENKALIVC